MYAICDGTGLYEKMGGLFDFTVYPLMCLWGFLSKEYHVPIYYKFEGNNTSGFHKLNRVIAQAYYAKKQGLKGVTTETGAG